jgi:hypothetical protein
LQRCEDGRPINAAIAFSQVAKFAVNDAAQAFPHQNFIVSNENGDGQVVS